MLEGLYLGAKLDAEARLAKSSIAEIERFASETASPVEAIEHFKARSKVGVIAEIKRASPSRGQLAEIKDPSALAKTCESAGAAAISVLTEERKFLGSLEDLQAVSIAVEIPTLRKDFISLEQQILEARVAGAAMVLLIVAGLEQERLAELHEFALQLGLAALVETHSADEVNRANDIGAKLIGVNARNLQTFETDRNLFDTLRALIADDALSVAESAVRNIADVESYARSGADLVLVGEALVTGDADKLLREFSNVARV
jgi:indole-3-glycerol phosphate synthase